MGQGHRTINTMHCRTVALIFIMQHNNDLGAATRGEDPPAGRRRSGSVPSPLTDFIRQNHGYDLEGGPCI